MSWLRRRLGLAPAVVEVHYSEPAPTVFVVEDQDADLLAGIAFQVFGCEVWYDDTRSDQALEELNAVGERCDLGYSQ